jgi:hypothetical protein
MGGNGRGHLERSLTIERLRQIVNGPPLMMHQARDCSNIVT